MDISGYSPMRQLLSAGLASLATFGFFQSTSGHVIAGGLFALLSAVMAAFLTSLPGILRERNARKAREEERHIAWLEQRITYHSQREVLVRKSKHNALEQLEEAQAHITRLRGILRETAADIPPYDFKYYDELCGDEDRALAMLTLPLEVRESAKG